MKIKKSNILLLLFSFIFLFFFTTTACEKAPESTNKENIEASSSSSTHSADTPAEPVKKKVTIGAVGDILIHDRVYNPVKTAEGFDFNPLLSAVKPLLSAPDLVLANQETILGGEALGLSGYPRFNSPQEVGDALKAAGIDVVSTANNHALDRGAEGVAASIRYLDQIGLDHVGTYASPEDEKQIKTIDRNGIRIAFLSYTFGTNGIPVPEGKEYMVHLIDKNKMSLDIKKARQQSDLVVMSLHWGTEYQTMPDDTQKQLARFLADEGADVIFGSHPHVLQPMEWLTASDGRKALVVYSLGNFLSGQKDDGTDLGGLATIDVTKTTTDDQASISLSNLEFFPTYVALTKESRYKTVPLEDAGSYGLKNSDQQLQEVMTHMTKNLND